MRYFFAILMLATVMGFVSIKSVQPSFYADDKFDVQGHRGCRGLMPENTILAMYKAIDLDVSTLEMDLVITKDRKVILSHEPWFESEITTKPDGSYIEPGEAMKYNIFEMTYEEVAKYDVGMKPHSRFPRQQKLKAVKPLFSDLIDSVSAYCKSRNKPLPFFNIETKCLPAGDNRYNPVPSEIVELIMAVVKEKNIEDKIIVQSFDPRSLKYLHEKYPSVKTSLLIEDSEVKSFDDQLKNLGFIPTIYSPNNTMVDEDMVKLCHEKGMKVIPWTVNDMKRIKKLRKMGIDGVITDYPDLFK